MRSFGRGIYYLLKENFNAQDSSSVNLAKDRIEENCVIRVCRVLFSALDIFTKAHCKRLTLKSQNDFKPCCVTNFGPN